MITTTFQRLRHVLCVAPFAVLLAISTAAFADPPSRVGRVTFIQGEVSLFLDREDGWQRAQINIPITSENSLWTENAGRAEVRIGASALRLDDRSLLDFVRLEDDLSQTYLQRGAINLRLRTDDGTDRAERHNERETFRVETSAGRFVFSTSGRYSVESLADGGETRVSVYFGRAHFESRDGRISIEAGKTLIVHSSGNSSAFHFERASESSFDRWAASRDQEWDRIHTRYALERNISPYMTGYEDLDANGEWIDDREYGRLWTPRVVVSDWAPYRYGRWTNLQPWGWTWVDDAPWGFAPFHYGRWVYLSHRSRWAWWPGPYERRPVYAPALVAWFNRPGVNITISSGPSVGWCPLAPREHYLPAYSNNVNYIRRINYVTNNVTIINPPARYANQLPGATVVNDHIFHRGQHVGRNIAPVPTAVIAAQAPGTGANFGPRFNRQDGQRDRRNDDRGPTPSFAPSSPPPPVLPAQPGQGPAIGVAPQFNKPLPVPAAGGPLSVVKPVPVPAAGGALPPVVGQPATPPTRIRSAPQQAQPLQPANPSMESRPVVVTPAPVARNAPPSNIEESQRANMQRPRRERPGNERAPVQANPPMAPLPTERAMGDRVVPAARPPQTVNEPRPAPRPLARPEHEGKPVPVPLPKVKPLQPADDQKREGQSRPVER